MKTLSGYVVRWFSGGREKKRTGKFTPETRWRAEQIARGWAESAFGTTDFVMVDPVYVDAPKVVRCA
jgi:hypothetical protein